MRRLFHVIIILVILALGLFSCSESKERAQLRKIEKMMDGNPDADSAMLLLQSINPQTLSSEGDKAYYALLMTQAEEKTTDMIADDSLISIAVKYYSRGKDTYYNMLSQYYLGRTKFYAEDYPHSIVAMFKALECATELDNKFWMGMICRSLADTFNETYNGANELIYAQKEYRYFKDSGKQPYANYALLDLARSYNNSDMYDSAIFKSNQCVDSAIKSKDQYLYVCAKRISGKSNLGKNQNREALSSYLEVCNSDYANTSDSAFLGLSYIGCGDVSKAMDLLKNIPDEEVLLKNMLKYEIYEKLNITQQAITALKNVDSLSNKMFKTRMGMNLTSAVVDYYKLSKEAAKSENEAAQKGFWLVVIASILILLILAIVAHRAYIYYQKQQERIEQNLEIAEQLRKILMTKEVEFDKTYDSMRFLISSNFKTLDKICQQIFENGDPKVARKHISDSVTSLIQQMNSDSNIIEMLEKFADIHHSNLISDFKADLPSLPDSYNKLFLFSVLGFSDNTITLLMDKKSVTQIYNYRRHLKDKIKCLDENRRNKYLEYL